jgi:hypothetical protein
LPRSGVVGGLWLGEVIMGLSCMGEWGTGGKGEWGGMGLGERVGRGEKGRNAGEDGYLIEISANARGEFRENFSESVSCHLRVLF